MKYILEQVLCNTSFMKLIPPISLNEDFKYSEKEWEINHMDPVFRPSSSKSHARWPEWKMDWAILIRFSLFTLSAILEIPKTQQNLVHTIIIRDINHKIETFLLESELVIFVCEL